MSWLSNAVKAIGKAGKDVGHFAGKVLSNPIVQTASAFIPGVGPLITAGEGALGGLLRPGGNLGRAATGALSGAAAGFAGGGIKRLGAGALGSLLHRGGPVMDANGIDGQGDFAHAEDGFGFGTPSDPAGIADAIWNGTYTAGGSGGGGVGGFLSGAAKKIGGGLLNGLTGQGQGGGLGGLGNLALGGLAGYQALNAANASKRAGHLSDQALALAEQRWKDAAPLRTAGQATLLNPVRPDLSAVFTDPSNPFARPAVRRL